MDLLGEGGYSYVYLVKSQQSGSLFALKKINCPFVRETFQMSMKEVDACKEFKSPYIIHSIDSSVVQEENGSKTVYILLPYFQNGSLQDIIDHNNVDGTNIEERDALRIAAGVCRGLVAMHRHHSTTGAFDSVPTYRDNDNASEISGPDDEDPFLTSEERQELLRNPHKADETPTTNGDEIPANPVSDASNAELSGTELDEGTAVAHGDIKPGNIMLSSDGTPILCDLGTCYKADVTIKTRSQVVTIQDRINECCTLEYRAPEMLDISVGTHITEKADIWALGCTLYALLYGNSPFEREQKLHGANIRLAIASGKYSFPDKPKYSDAMHELIKSCLTVAADERPTIEDVLSKVLEMEGSN